MTKKWYDAELVGAAMEHAGLMPTKPNPYFEDGAHWWHDEHFMRHGPYPTEQDALRGVLVYMALMKKRPGRVRKLVNAVLQVLSRRPRT